MRKGEDVYDSTTDGKLSRFVYEVNFFELIAVEKIFKESTIQVFTFFNNESIAGQRLLIDDFLYQRFGICNNELFIGLACDECEHLRTHEHIGILNFVILVWPLVRHGEKEHFLFAQQMLKIVQKVRSLFFVMQNNKVTGFYRFAYRCKNDSIKATAEAL